MEITKSKNSRLEKENKYLKASLALSLSNRARFLPVSSSPTTSNEEKKADNIRNTYAKVKRRYDDLHKVASDLSTCTRSIDLNGFGEFGHYLKQLRTALEQDSQKQ